MIIERLVEKLPVNSHFTKLVIGSIATASVISLGMVGILKLLNFSLNPGIPSAFAAVGAAAYTASLRK